METFGSILQSRCRKALTQALAQTRSHRRLLILSNDYYDTSLKYPRSLSLLGAEGWWREIGVEFVIGLDDENECGESIARWDNQAVVFVVRGGDWRSAKLVGEAIKGGRGKGWEGESIVVVVWGGWGAPGSVGMSERIVRLEMGSASEKEDEGDAVKFLGVEWGFIPFGVDAVTLDDIGGFRRMMLEGDDGVLRVGGSALGKLLDVLHREVGVVRAVGGAAQAVAEELIKCRDESLWKRRRKVRDIFEDRSPTLAELRSQKEPEKDPLDIVMVDRSVDLVTPLLTQWTYDGLLDEVFSVSGNLLSVDPSQIESKEASAIISERGGVYNKLLTSSHDPLYQQLRHENFSSTSTVLSEKAKSVESYYAARPVRTSDTKTSAIKSYVEGLRRVKDSHAGVSAHTALSSEISARIFESADYKKRFETEQELLNGVADAGRVTYLVDCCAKGLKQMHVLRLSCLWSLTAGGIDRESLELIRGEMIAAHGLRSALLLANLERAGLLMPSQSLAPESANAQIMGFFTNLASFAHSVNPLGARTGEENDASAEAKRAASFSWQYVRAAMALLEDHDPEEHTPVGPGRTKAIAAPYSGYVGLSVRLIQAGIEGWHTLPPIPGHHLLLPRGQTTKEYTAHLEPRDEVKVLGSSRDERSTWSKGGDDESAKQKNAVDVVVMFVGGVTRAEITAVRAAGLAKGLRVLVATTAVMSGDTFLAALDEASD